MPKGEKLKPGTKRSSWAVRKRSRYSVAEHTVVHVHSLAFVVDTRGRLEAIIVVHPTDGITESHTRAELAEAERQRRQRSVKNRSAAKLATAERKRQRKGQP